MSYYKRLIGAAGMAAARGIGSGLAYSGMRYLGKQGGFGGQGARPTYTRKRAIPRPLKGYVRYGGAYGRGTMMRRGMLAESKYADMATANGNVATSTTKGQIQAATTGTITNWFNIPGGIGAQASLIQVAQGTSKNQRLANKMLLYEIRVHLDALMEPNNAGANNYDQLRVILYKDMQANGAACTPAEILDNAVNGTVNYDSFQAIDYVDRIKILKDIRIDFNANYGTSGTGGILVLSSGPMMRTVKFHHKCSEEIRFSSTTGTITEIQSVNYGVLLVSSFANIYVQGQARAYFKDH